MQGELKLTPRDNDLLRAMKIAVGSGDTVSAAVFADAWASATELMRRCNQEATRADRWRFLALLSVPLVGVLVIVLSSIVVTGGCFR